MAFRRKQHLVIMLSMDVDKSIADLPENGNRCGMSVDPCGASAVCSDLTGQQKFIVHMGNGKRIQSRTDQRIQVGEKRCHHCFFAAGSHNVPCDTLPQHRMDAVQQNGLSGAGLTGKHVEPG